MTMTTIKKNAIDSTAAQAVLAKCEERIERLKRDAQNAPEGDAGAAWRRYWQERDSCAALMDRLLHSLPR